MVGNLYSMKYSVKSTVWQVQYDEATCIPQFLVTVVSWAMAEMCCLVRINTPACATSVDVLHSPTLPLPYPCGLRISVHAPLLPPRTPQHVQRPPACSAAGYLCELSLLEGGCLSLLPSQVAAASFVWAMALLQRKVGRW